MSLEDGQTDCGFDGNPEVYGLGIRIGIYLQAVAIIVSTLFRQTSVLSRVSYGNGLFQFALTVGLCVLTATSPDFKAVEAAIVVLLAHCSSFQADNAEDRQGLYCPSTLEQLQQWIKDTGLPAFRTIVELILISYSAWFWFVGLDRLPHSNNCTSFGFFFTSVDLYGWFRTLGKIYIVIEILSQILMTVVWFKGLVNKEDTTSEPSQAPHSTGKWYTRNWHWIIGFNRVLLTVFFVLSVELMIRWNQINSVSGLSNVGQLVAFLVGFGGIVSVILDWEGKPRTLVPGTQHNP